MLQIGQKTPKTALKPPVFDLPPFSLRLRQQLVEVPQQLLAALQAALTALQASAWQAPARASCEGRVLLDVDSEIKKISRYYGYFTVIIIS